MSPGPSPSTPTHEPPTRRRTARRRVARTVVGAVSLVTVAALTATGSAWSASAATATTTTATTAGATQHRDVLANLFEWNWPSVGRECTNVLGPSGYGGVQVAPPADSLKRTELGNGSDTVLHPWWEVYQPVDYGLTSRMGTPQQFRDMVRTCRAAGVKVYVDAVINHMTGQGSVSYGGVTYTHYGYPAYTAKDFHVPNGDCPSASGGIEDFNNEAQVWNCELLGLADLDTGTTYVRNRIAGYLNTLISYGVSGFRVDAGKHIAPADTLAIVSRLHDTLDGTRPAIWLEVFGGGPGALSPQAYSQVEPVLGLDAVKQLRDAFKSYPADHVGSIATLRVFGAGSGLTPSDRTLVFVQNHDTERNGDALSYKDGATNVLANEFVLAYGYGQPQVYSGFEFGDDTNQSPPSKANGRITDTNCASGWACVDRDRGVRHLVGFHNAVGDAARAHWYDDGMNLIAFSRGTRGWIALNNATTPKTVTVQTGMAPGTYCDIVHGSTSHGTCSGPTVTVDAQGRAQVTVPAKDAVAFTRGDRL